MKRMAIISFAFLVASCFPEPLDVKNIPAVKGEIVVSTLMVPDRRLLVMLTRTIGALEATGDSDPEWLLNQVAVSDATVILAGAGRSDTLLYMDFGVYGGVAIPFREGEEYHLHVISETMGEVEATTTVKRQVPFDAIEASLFSNDFGDSLAQVTFSLADPEEKNWYMINVQEVERQDLVENALNPNAFNKLVDDATFNGTLYEDAFKVFTRDYGRGDTIAVSVSNINEDYYRFVTLRADNRFSFTEFFSEPVNYPTNVRGGRGFFNLYLPDFRFFVLE